MRHRVRSALTIVTATAVLLATLGPPSHAVPAAGTGGGAAPAQSTTESAAVEWTGEEVFTGLFLGYGPVAERFPELVVGSIGADATPEELAALVAQITDGVTNVDPSFFGTFGDAVTSGDRVRASQALQSGQTMLETVLTEQIGASPTAVDDQRAQGVLIAIIFVLVAAFNVAVAVNAVFGLHVHVNVNVNLTYTRNPIRRVHTPIDFELWVDDVAGALSA